MNTTYRTQEYSFDAYPQLHLSQSQRGSSALPQRWEIGMRLAVMQREHSTVTEKSTPEYLGRFGRRGGRPGQGYRGYVIEIEDHSKR